MNHMAPVNLGQFNQVRLLILHHVTAANWPSQFPNNLKYLKIYTRSKDREEVFKKAISLNGIERLEFNSSFLHFHDCNDILPKPSTIKHLEFNSKRCFIDYQFLLNNMPYLQSLHSINTHYPHRFNGNLRKFTFLTTINLVCKHIDIDAMIIFLTNIAANSLRRCRLINSSSSLLTNIANVLLS